MKYYSFFAAAMLLTSTLAHTWLECTMAEYSDSYMNGWKALVAKAWQSYSGGVQSPPAKATYSNDAFQYQCKGYPRNKIHNGDWIAESTYYSYSFNTTYACHADQRTFLQADGTPAAVVRPGQEIKMRFWGNGHSRWDIGSPLHRDPGLIRIYWAGKPETEIVYASDLTEKYWIPGAQANYTADAIVFPAKSTVPSMDEKVNIFNFKVPEKIQNGRHMMVFEWAWKPSVAGWDGSFDPNVYNTGFDQAWGTCFTLTVVDSTFTGAVCPDIAAYQPGYNAKAKAEAAKLKTKICSMSGYIAGMKSSPCTGAACPPCFVRNGNEVDTYNYQADGTCPFGGFDCKGAGGVQPKDTNRSPSYKAPTPPKSPTPPTSPTSPTPPAQQKKSGICSKQCYIGGMKPQPCNPAQKSCPPCRVSGAGGTQVDCYSYDAGGTCPFNGQDCSKSGLSTRSVPQLNTTPATKSSCDCVTKCFRGGISTASCDPAKESCPPCRHLGGEGQINCFDYKPNTTQCPFPHATICPAPNKKRDLADALARTHRRRRRHM